MLLDQEFIDKYMTFPPPGLQPEKPVSSLNFV